MEPVLKDHLNGHKNVVSKQVVFGDRVTIEMWDILPGICGPSRQVVSHVGGLSRKVSP